MANKINVQSIIVAIGAVAVAVCTSLLFIDNRVHAQTDAGIAVHESRIVALEQQVPQLRTEVYEGRQDTRALQEVIMTNQRSDRLSRPLAPPPKPDSGSAAP